MNPELLQRIQNLMGDQPLPAMAAGGEVGFDPMKVPSIDKSDLTSSINALMDQKEGGASLSTSDRIKMIVDQSGIKSEEDLLKIEPYLPDLGAGASLMDRLASISLDKIPFIKKTLLDLNKNFADDVRALTQSKSLPEAFVNASKFHPTAMKVGMATDAINSGITALRKADGGEVSQEEMMIQTMEAQAEAQAETDPNGAIESAIEEMLMQASQTKDPIERDQYLHLAEAAEVGANAPLGQMAVELTQAGRGEDTALAHLRPGEVILPPEAFEDEKFESLIEAKFNEMDIDPRRMTVGVGIASLNPITGLEEFGFWKKTAKSLKKVVKQVIKPLVKIAQFIPGPWQPFAAIAAKAWTVYDVAKGNASPLQLLTLGGPNAVGGSIGQNITDIAAKGAKAAEGGGFFEGIGSLVKGKGADNSGSFGSLGDLFTGKGADQSGGLGSLGDIFTGTGSDKVGRFGKIGDILGGIGDSVGITDYYKSPENLREADRLIEEIIATEGETNPAIAQQVAEMRQAGKRADEILQIIGLQAEAQEAATGQAPSFLKSILNFFTGGGAGGIGGGGGGGGLNLSGLGGAGVAAVLAKLAYDEAKNRKGVQLTPAMTMSKYGGYQLAKRDAEAAGVAPPDPRDFGMMATGMPTLSGGRKKPSDSGDPTPTNPGDPTPTNPGDPTPTNPLPRPAFDGAAYLSLYPDLQQEARDIPGFDPETHWKIYGQYEGRKHGQSAAYDQQGFGPLIGNGGVVGPSNIDVGGITDEGNGGINPVVGTRADGTEIRLSDLDNPTPAALANSGIGGEEIAAALANSGIGGEGGFGGINPVVGMRNGGAVMPMRKASMFPPNMQQQFGQPTQMNQAQLSPLNGYSTYLNQTYTDPQSQEMQSKVTEFVDLVDQAERAHFGAEESFGSGKPSALKLLNQTMGPGSMPSPIKQRQGDGFMPPELMNLQTMGPGSMPSPIKQNHMAVMPPSLMNLSSRRPSFGSGRESVGNMVPMAYATGGNVSTADFKEKSGIINGEGTETSDDVPAMLSDGEFVMTGRAVRGAGSLSLGNENGIITLKPTGPEDREKGTQLLYEMMELFEEYADKPKSRVNAA